MYKIAICDDEATSLALNSSLTKKILEEEKIEYSIDTFSNMNQMIRQVTSAAVPYDVLLSDILTTEMNGIDAAAKLRELGEKMPIIFISSTAEYALEGYRVNALRYLQKPYRLDALREALLTAYHQMRKKERLHLTSGDKTYRIAYADIYYLESNSRDVNFYFKDDMLSVRMKFADVEKMLPEANFCKCHRSYIVNMQHVTKVERYQATLENQAVVPISQMQYNDTKTMFLTFIH